MLKAARSGALLVLCLLAPLLARAQALHRAYPQVTLSLIC